MNNLIRNEKVWPALLEAGNATLHVYGEKLSNEIADRIKNE